MWRAKWHLVLPPQELQSSLPTFPSIISPLRKSETRWKCSASSFLTLLLLFVSFQLRFSFSVGPLMKDHDSPIPNANPKDGSKPYHEPPHHHGDLPSTKRTKVVTQSDDDEEEESVVTAVSPKTNPKTISPESSFADSLVAAQHSDEKKQHSSNCSCCGASQRHLVPQPMTCPDAMRDLLRTEAGYTTGTGTPKRSHYISWDTYFMATAILSAQRSKDPSQRRGGACLVDARHRILGTGYKGLPYGASDAVIPWGSPDSPWLHNADSYAVQPEINAILNRRGGDCEGSRLYTHVFPEAEAAKLIIQARVGEVIYVHDLTDNSENAAASRILLQLAGVQLRKYTLEEHDGDALVLDFRQALDESERHLRNDTTTDDDSNATEDPHVDRTREILARETNYQSPATSTPSHRQDYLSWTDYFLSMALLTSQRSKDPNTQVGACLVDERKRIVGLGYNGFPTGCSDDVLPWSRHGSEELHKKYLYVCHAEVNAIMNSCIIHGESNITLYVALFPCHECAKVIAQCRSIRTVVYLSDRYHDTDACRISRAILGMAEIVCKRHVPARDSVTIDFRV